MQQSKLEQKFWEYHGKNPQVFTLFKEYAFQLLNAGRSRYSARTIIHRIRWHNDITTTGDDGFKICNNHSPYYALLLEATCPEFKDFFSHRGDVQLTFEKQMSLDEAYFPDRTPIEDRYPVDVTDTHDPNYMG
jgi:hypothetical protein